MDWRRIFTDVLLFFRQVYWLYGIIHNSTHLILSYLIVLNTRIWPIWLLSKIGCGLLHFEYLVVRHNLPCLWWLYVIITSRIILHFLHVYYLSVNICSFVDFPRWMICCIFCCSPFRTHTLIIFRHLFCTCHICVGIYLRITKSIALKRHRFTKPFLNWTSHFRLCILISYRATWS